MTKILAATCSPASIVTAAGLPVAGAVILSEGKQQSSGFLVIDGDKIWYVASSATDIKTTIEKLVALLDKLSTVVTTTSTGLIAAGSALDGIAGGSGTAVTAAGNNLTPIVSELASLKVEMNLLKGALK